MDLYHWDIQGAFMTSTLDTVFMDLPPGYSLPEGKCILLKKSWRHSDDEPWQEKYIETLLELFNMHGCKPETTPFESGGHLLKLDAPTKPDPEQIKNYQQLIGGLIWASTFTRPDISYTVNQCAKHMANPGDKHVLAAKRILKCLAGTKSLKLTYRCSNGPDANRLKCYADTDHAGDPEQRKSTTGYVLLLNGGAV
eukprot:462212-Rhodomonas_salina.3